MNERDVLSELERLGSEQTRKTYKRHGVGDKQFGVSYADLGKLQKKLKTDHDLARKLWSSGIHDAQILATMIADPSLVTSKEIDAWAKGLSNYVLTDALAGLVSKTRFAEEKSRGVDQSEGRMDWRRRLASHWRTGATQSVFSGRFFPAVSRNDRI